MNKRKLTIIFLIVAPLIGLAIVSFINTVPSDNVTVKRGGMSVAPVELPPTTAKADYSGPPKTLEEARERLRQRLKVLDGMTDAQWYKEQMEREVKIQKVLAEEKERLREEIHPEIRYPALDTKTATPPPTSSDQDP